MGLIKHRKTKNVKQIYRSAYLLALNLNKSRNLLRIHAESYREFGIHASLGISQDLLVLLIKALALILEHLPSGTYGGDNIYDILTVAARQKAVKSLLTLISVLDPLHIVIIDAVDKVQRLLLGDDRLDLGCELLIVKGDIYDLSLIDEQRPQYVILLGTLMIKTHIFDIVDLADTAAAVYYRLSLRESHILPLSVNVSDKRKTAECGEKCHV